MDRKEIYVRLDEDDKFDFRVGELAYNRETEYGTKPLTVPYAQNLTTEELVGILMFIMQLKISVSSDIAARDDVTLESCGNVLDQRRVWKRYAPPLSPSYHGENCIANGEHAGIECCCDECNFYLECWPDWREMAFA